MNTPTELSDRWHFHAISNSRAHEEVVEQIIYSILSGAYKPGDRMPNVEVLAREMCVSKPVVGEALKLLSQAGVVQAKRGINGGLSVETDDVPESIMARTAPLRHLELRDIIEARRPVEVELALLATRRAEDEDLEKLALCVERLREHRTSSLVQRIRHDHLFHYMVGRTARSQALSYYQHQILEQLFVRMRSYFELMEDVDQVIDLHERTLAAIASGDESTVRSAIDEHLRPLESAALTLQAQS